MKKIARCVPLGFVTAVIFLLGNAAPAQAALVCEWGYISVGGNEYIRQLICYENGGEGREDVRYGTRPGSNNPRDGGGVVGDVSAIELPKDPSGAVEWLKVFKAVKDFCKKPNESCSPAWTTRMTAGAPGVRAICQQVGIGIQGTCNAEVALEASFGCPNVSDC